MVLLSIYIFGVIIALAVMRDPWPERVATAVVWPLGPLAFVVVIAILLVAAGILWPWLVLAGLAVVGLLAWLTL